MIGLLTSRAGQIGGLAILVLVALGWVYAKGYGSAVDAGEVAQLEAQLAAAERDREIATLAAADEAERAEAAEARGAQLERIADEQRSALARLDTADRCVWAGNQLDRLRAILE